MSYNGDTIRIKSIFYKLYEVEKLQKTMATLSASMITIDSYSCMSIEHAFTFVYYRYHNTVSSMNINMKVYSVHPSFIK